MNTVIHTPQISLFSEQEEPQNYEIYIYGTGNFNKLHHDSFGLTLDRYLREINISQKMLSRLTGIAPSTISRYLSGKRNIRYDYLCAVCIALKLHPSRQRHLFTLMRYAMPCETSICRQSEYIIRAYLDGCAFNVRYNLTACNERLRSIRSKPLTSLTSDKEDSK